VGYEFGDGYRAELSYERVHDDAARPYRANIGAIIGGRPVPLTRPYELDRQNIVLNVGSEIPEGLLNPRLQLAYSATDLDIVEEDQTTFGRTPSFNGTLSNLFDFDLGTVNAGADFYVEEAEVDYRFLPDSAFDERGTDRNVGVLAQTRLYPTDRLSLSFGGRADFQHHEGIEGSSSNNAGVSGNLSGSYELIDGLTASAGASHVWGGVELAENFLINPGWVYPDDGLEPTTADSVFGGLSFDFGPLVPALEGLFVKGKVFRTTIEDAAMKTIEEGRQSIAMSSPRVISGRRL
jgi:hemoglobin/transferrin/lactoferrin receptor protein